MQSSPYHRWTGVSIAAMILATWLGHLVFSLSLDMLSFPVPLLLIMVLVQTFLFTGLFITAHDAMHGTVAPGRPKLNNWLGSMFVLLYAMFSFKKLLQKHREHHKFPGTANDPDFYPRERQNFLAWYGQFMANYLSWQQIVGMAIVFNLLHHGLGVPIRNLLSFWVAPALLSTLQLFYFGTYLTHRKTPQPFVDHHRARSNNYPWLGSFLTCYHFGYHLEHHHYPGVPWWQLPLYRKPVSKG